MVTEGEHILLEARSVLEDINIPAVVEGTLPSAPGEAAVEEKMASELGLAVGDEITLEHDKNLTAETFQITAAVNEPSYCYGMFKDAPGFGTAGTGSNEYYIMLSASAFDASYYDDCFTTAYVINDTLAGLYYFSDEYESQEAALMDQLDVLGQERAQLRYDQLNDEATTKLADAQADIDAAAQEIQDAQAEIEDNEATIAQSEQEIADGEQAIADGRQTLKEAKQQISDQLSALGLDEDFSTALTQLEALGTAGEPLRAAIVEYQAGEEKLSDSETELANAREELEDGKARLDEARTEVADAQSELAQAEAELADAREDAAELEALNADSDCPRGHWDRRTLHWRIGSGAGRISCAGRRRLWQRGRGVGRQF